jgi:hypothetical protein
MELSIHLFVGTQKAMNADTVLPGAGQFEGVNFAKLNVTIDAATAYVRISRRMMNTHEASVIVTQRAPNAVFRKSQRKRHRREQSVTQ